MTMYSVKQVAEMFGCKTATVRKAIHEGRIEGVRVGFAFVVMQEEVNRLKERGHFRFKDDRSTLGQRTQAEGILGEQEQDNSAV